MLKQHLRLDDESNASVVADLVRRVEKLEEYVREQRKWFLAVRESLMDELSVTDPQPLHLS